ncbi:MAG: hypothetical protein AAF485_15025 [Chloroflexota bacterium]
MEKIKWGPLLFIPIIVILGFLGGRYLYYNANANTYVAPDVPLRSVEFEESSGAEWLEAVDNPVESDGVVIIDYAHSNALFIEELNILLTKIVARGYSYEVVFAAGAEEESFDGGGLINKLAYAETLILPLPRIDYTDAEVLAIEQFVEKGGRLFIIGDPTRTIGVEALNSIAGSFGIIYANDYLYSLEDNDNNYRNVVYTDFADNALTEGLGGDSKIIFYSAASISAPGHEIIMGGDQTFSSISEGGRTLAAAALTTNDQVLAIGDLTFFGEPYSAAENNGTLINNIATFLTDGTRTFALQDFPFLFNEDIDIVFDDSLVFNSQFLDSVQLKEFLERLERDVNFADTIANETDAIYIGRFDNLEPVESYLEAANIAILPLEADEEAMEDGEEATEDSGDEETSEDELALVSDAPIEKLMDQEFVEGRIQIEGIGELERGGSTLFYLHQEENRNILIILSDTPDTNQDAFTLLFDNQLNDCRASDVVAVCQTEEPSSLETPSIRPRRIDKILIVSDNDGRPREDDQTSVAEYEAVLEDTYKINTWDTADEGSPDLEELLEYDAIIWTTGDYWDDSISGDDVDLLTSYMELGGNLILSGASIAFDWDHTEFLSDIAHADYLDFDEQVDAELVNPDHPIARGFDEDAVIEFLDTPSGETLESDVVAHTIDSRVIFQRGSDSDETGAAAVIVYEDERIKVAYLSFPFYLLPEEEADLLAENIVDWFTRRLLDPPSERDYDPYISDGRDDSSSNDASDEDLPVAGEGDEEGASDGEGTEGEETDESGSDDTTDGGDDSGSESDNATDTTDTTNDG